ALPAYTSVFRRSNSESSRYQKSESMSRWCVNRRTASVRGTTATCREKALSAGSSFTGQGTYAHPESGPVDIDDSTLFPRTKTSDERKAPDSTWVASSQGDPMASSTSDTVAPLHTMTTR